MSIVNNLTKKVKASRDVRKAVESLLELSKCRVSFHLAVHMDGKTKSFGTKYACERFEEVREVFEGALLKDVVHLCNPEPNDLQFVSNVDNIDPRIKNKIKRQNNRQKNRRELSQSQERFALNLRGIKNRFFLMSSSFIFFIFF